MADRDFKQIVIKHPNGMWACWYAVLEENVLKPPPDSELTFGQTLFGTLRRARKKKPGRVLYTYLKDFSKGNM